MNRRFIVSALIFLTILFLPYWVYLPLLFLGMVLSPFYWEALVFAFLIDILYGEGHSLFLSPMALTTLFILAVLPLLRERLRWQI